jgi:hypothetical protein
MELDGGLSAENYAYLIEEKRIRNGIDCEKKANEELHDGQV